MTERLYCKQPDRDCPTMECGYPLPCPWHTAIIDSKGLVHLPEQVKPDTLEKLVDVGKIVRQFNEP